MKRNRDTERQKITERPKESEIRSPRDSDATDETDDVPPLAARVQTLPEAVQIGLKDGVGEKCLFSFSRALKAFEITVGRPLSHEDLDNVFCQWWAAARPLLPEGSDFDEYRFDFLDTFGKTKSALGSNTLEEAIRRAKQSQDAPQALRYQNPQIRFLVTICWHLQQIQGSGAIFLGVRDAARILGNKPLPHASAVLMGLCRDGVLRLEAPGSARRARRFRFLASDATPEADTPPTTTPKTELHSAQRSIRSEYGLPD